MPFVNSREIKSMSSNIENEGIIISNSNLPIIRAGFANIILLLLFIALILVNQMLNSFNVPLFFRALILLGVFLVMLKIYNHSVSRLFFKDGKSIVLVGPFCETVFDSSEIKATQVYGIPTSMTIFIMIKKTTSFVPKFYFFVALSTNHGSYTDTKTKLISLLKEINFVGCQQITK